VANDKSQAEGCNFSRNVIQSSLLCVNNREQQTSTVPKNRGTCGIAVLKNTVKVTVLAPQKNGTYLLKIFYLKRRLLYWPFCDTALIQNL